VQQFGHIVIENCCC